MRTPATLAFLLASRHALHAAAAPTSSLRDRKPKASASPSLKQRCAGERSDQRGVTGAAGPADAPAFASLELAPFGGEPQRAFLGGGGAMDEWRECGSAGDAAVPADCAAGGDSARLRFDEASAGELSMPLIVGMR